MQTQTDRYTVANQTPDRDETQADTGSGLSTGRRTHEPLGSLDSDAIDAFVFEPNDEPIWAPEADDGADQALRGQAYTQGYQAFPDLDASLYDGQDLTADEHEIEYDVSAGV